MNLKNPKNWSSSKQTELVHLIASGKTVAQVASHFGVSPRSIHVQLNYIGKGATAIRHTILVDGLTPEQIVERQSPVPSKRYKTWHRDKHVELVRMIGDGYTYDQIANRLGNTFKGVSSQMYVNGTTHNTVLKQYHSGMTPDDIVSGWDRYSGDKYRVPRTMHDAATHQQQPHEELARKPINVRPVQPRPRFSGLCKYATTGVAGVVIGVALTYLIIT